MPKIKNYHKEIIVKPAKRLLNEIKQPENEVKKAITEFLEWQGWTVYRINNAGIFRGYNEKGQERFSFGGSKGVGDLYAVKIGGKYPLWIETKGTGKKPSADQREFIHKVNNGGGYAVWADSLDMFREIYHDLQLGYGLPKSMINAEAK